LSAAKPSLLAVHSAAKHFGTNTASNTTSTSIIDNLKKIEVRMTEEKRFNKLFQLKTVFCLFYPSLPSNNLKKLTKKIRRF